MPTESVAQTARGETFHDCGFFDDRCAFRTASFRLGSLASPHNRGGHRSVSHES